MFREGIIKGEREDIPEGCPVKFGELIQECWRNKPEERPEITIVIEKLEKIKGELIKGQK